MYTKLKKITASILWLLGLFILLAQTFRIVMFYVAGWDYEVDILRDGFIAVIGVAFMYVQAPVKSAVRRIIDKVK